MLDIERARFYFHNDLNILSYSNLLKMSDKVKLVPHSFKEFPQFFVFSKKFANKNKEIVDFFDQQLLLLKEQGKLEQIYLKYTGGVL